MGFCPGPPVPAGSLIELIAPVYSLDDVPTRWHTDRFRDQGSRRSLLDLCVWIRSVSSSDLDVVFVK
eukprot:9499179-Lingulodinium_polyedra.AAC.1